MTKLYAPALAASISTLALFVTGCGVVSGPPSAITSEASFSGVLHGGQQAVAHATVALYAPGTTSYGSAPTLIVSTTSDAAGNFVMPRPYTCPANSGNVYILATGGDSGTGTNNTIALAALLGPCANLTANTYISISEVTTVAAAYALAPFAAIFGATTSIGTSATNLIGLNNAFGPANNLANTTDGTARGANSVANMVLPTTTVNTLADILAACINTSGSTVSTAPCGKLFTAATPPAGAAPVDTFQAAIDIALNPGNNSALLFALSNSQAPFQPTLTTDPGDFALAIQYTGGQIAGSQFTTGMAIDANGNAWVGNGNGNTSPKSVSEISPAGAFLSGPNGYLNGTAGGNGYSIDAGGNVYIGVAALNSVYKLNQSGATVATYSPSGVMKPTGVAFDNRTGAIWAANSNNQPGDNNGFSDFEGTTVSYITGPATDGAGSPYGGNNGPFGVEIDGLGNVWIANSASNTTACCAGYLTRYTPPATVGNAYTAQNFSTGNNSFPLEIAFDSSNNVFASLTNTVGEYTNAGVPVGTTTASSTIFPSSLMVDGLGRIFVSNAADANFVGQGSLTVFSPTGTLISTANASRGYLAGGTINNEPFAPAGMGIDPSGNVWITGVNTSGALTPTATLRS